MKVSGLRWFACLFAAASACFAWPRAVSSEPAPHINVGVVVSGADDGRVAAYTDLFSQLQRGAAGRYSFSLAFGTAVEVDDWYDRGLVDAAVMTAGPSHVLFRPGPYDLFSDNYVASLEPASGAQKTLRDLVAFDPPRLRDGRLAREYYAGDKLPDFMYHSVCLVRNDSPIKDRFDLFLAAEGGKLTFLFDRPSSLAGHLAPRYLLEGRKISLSKNRAVFTGSQENSLKELYEGGEGAGGEGETSPPRPTNGVARPGAAARARASAGRCRAAASGPGRRGRGSWRCRTGRTGA